MCVCVDNNAFDTYVRVTVKNMTVCVCRDWYTCIIYCTLYCMVIHMGSNVSLRITKVFKVSTLDGPVWQS